MGTIKSCTDIEQSKKLAEILPLESADMYYTPSLIKGHTGYFPHLKRKLPIDWDIEQAIPCWSLAALLEVLPEGIIKNYYAPNLQKENGEYSIAYGDDELLCIADNPVDGCVEMILKLNKLKML
jgi:hypothetical protein